MSNEVLIQNIIAFTVVFVIPATVVGLIIFFIKKKKTKIKIKFGDDKMAKKKNIEEAPEEELAEVKIERLKKELEEAKEIKQKKELEEIEKQKEENMEIAIPDEFNKDLDDLTNNELARETVILSRKILKVLESR